MMNQENRVAAKTRSAAWVENYLGTSPQTVGRLIAEGKIEAYKLREGGAWHIPVKSVDAYLAGRKAKYAKSHNGGV